MKIIKNTGVILALFVGFGCSVASAKMYKCVGKDGKTTYQVTKCPVDAKVSTIQEADKIKTQSDRKNEDFQAVLKNNADKAVAAKALMEKKTLESDALFDKKIAELKKQNLSTAQVESEKTIARRDILLEYQKNQKKVVDALDAEEKKHRDKVKDLDKQIEDLHREGERGMREIEAASH